MQTLLQKCLVPFSAECSERTRCGVPCCTGIDYFWWLLSILNIIRQTIRGYLVWVWRLSFGGSSWSCLAWFYTWSKQVFVSFVYTPPIRPVWGIRSIFLGCGCLGVSQHGWSAAWQGAPPRLGRTQSLSVMPSTGTATLLLAWQQLPPAKPPICRKDPLLQQLSLLQCPCLPASAAALSSNVCLLCAMRPPSSARIQLLVPQQRKSASRKLGQAQVSPPGILFSKGLQSWLPEVGCQLPHRWLPRFLAVHHSGAGPAPPTFFSSCL